jgi:hypothetical protein
VWDPAGYISPQLKVTDQGFWLSRQLEIHSLNPALEDGQSWHRRYAIDRLGTHAWSGPVCWPLDLFWDDRERHVLLAELSPAAGEVPPQRYVVSTPAPEPLSLTWRLLRLVLLALPLAGLGSWLGWTWRHRHVQARRLRLQENPYTQGTPIQDPARFFGREDLLRKLRNTLATTSYALVGEFRIGKTSIQYQLTRVLESVQDPRYVFLPVFIDLQGLGPNGSDRFFHYLGGPLADLAGRHQVPAGVLGRLEWRRDQPAAYDSAALLRDLRLLLGHWRTALAPRTPVVVFQIDEITLMDDFPCAQMLAFRGVFNEQPLARTVVSGRQLRKDCDRPEHSQWWNIFKVEQVLPLTPREARALIVTPVRGLFSYDEDALERIMALAEGKPLRLQTICGDLLEYKYSCRPVTRRITLGDLECSLQSSPRSTASRR